MKKVAILSIDGGGIRGILPATVLVYLEGLVQNLTGKPDLKIGDVFDLIAGTSTGGILSCIYLAPGQNKKAKYSAQEALDLYMSHGQEIFHRTLGQEIETGGGFVGAKYSHEYLYELLTKYFGDLKLADLLKPSLITSYEMTARRAVFFTSADAPQDPDSNFFVRDVARATSGAPTYFAPAGIQSMDDRAWSLLDGGVFANNPALCAYAEALKIDFAKQFPNCNKSKPAGARDMLIISLGTGSVKKSYHIADFAHAGALKWLEPIIDVLMSGNSETVDYQLKSIYSTLQAADQTDYYRLEPTLVRAVSEMDLATPDNIANLHSDGLAFIENNKAVLNEIAKKIKDHCI
jgi:patatin-like phospholipase/acyl hydrolase